MIVLGHHLKMFSFFLSWHVYMVQIIPSSTKEAKKTQTEKCHALLVTAYKSSFINQPSQESSI